MTSKGCNLVFPQGQMTSQRSYPTIPHRNTTSKGHNLVFYMDKRPQKIIIRYSTWTNDLKRSQSTDKQPQKVTIWYSAQINNLTKVITHYPTQKYDLKRSQSGISHAQTNDLTNA